MLEAYNKQKPTLDRFALRLKTLITELIEVNGLQCHQISQRVKELDSIEEKIKRKEGKYNSLVDITDIVGVRVITYLDSDVDAIESVIRAEFKVDVKNSIDKRLHLANEFGYRSLHFIVELNDSRQGQTENKQYFGLRAEIQVRSILQHAWAEIEHNLGYKIRASIPDPVKRNFSRLAALLETADVEFDRLKREIAAYKNDVGTSIESAPDLVDINRESILYLISTNDTLKSAAEIVKQNTGCTLEEDQDVDTEIARFGFFKIDTIGQLENLLRDFKQEYLDFVDIFTGDLRYESMKSTIALFYFQHFLAAKSENIEYVEQYTNYGGIQISGDLSNKEMIEMYREAISRRVS